MPNKQVISLSLSDEVVNALNMHKSKTINRSQKAEQLLRQALELDPADSITSRDILGGKTLTDKQKEAARVLIREGISDVALSKAVSLVKSKGPYTQHHYAKEAVKAIHKDGDVPIFIRNNQVVTDTIVCGCGAELALHATDGGRCPSCGRILIGGL